MTDPIIIKILWGLIVISGASIFVSVIAHTLASKLKEVTQGQKPSVRLAFGSLVYMIIIVVWYIGLIWYWFSLLAQVE